MSELTAAATEALLAYRVAEAAYNDAQDVNKAAREAYVTARIAARANAKKGER